MTGPRPAPIRPGDEWISKGRGQHGAYTVRVIKRTAGGQVVYEATHSAGHRKRERKHTLTEEAFRAHYRPP